jgi:hypothetical protein
MFEETYWKIIGKWQVRTIFLLWLPWILRMSRPGKKITRKTIVMSSRMKELELKERSSRSLLANVLDMDDDFRTSASLGAPVPPPPHIHPAGYHPYNSSAGSGGGVAPSGGSIRYGGKNSIKNRRYQHKNSIQNLNESSLYLLPFWQVSSVCDD